LGISLYLWGEYSTADYKKYIENTYENPRIHNMNYEESIDNIYPNIDVCIVPSNVKEAFGRVVVEANSFGVPVIGSSRGGIPEIIINNKTGLLFDIEDQRDLLEKMLFFINNPDVIRSMAPHCLAHARNFLYGKITKQYLEVYKKIICK